MGYKLNGMYIGQQKIRPSGGWQPGANCLAYYKFATDGLDSTSNHNDCTVIGCQFGTIGDKQGIRLEQSYSNPPTNYILTPLVYTSLPVSICAWFYQTDNQDWQLFIGNAAADDSNNFRLRTYFSSLVITSYGGSDINMGNIVSVDQWICLGVTIDSLGQGILYKDGVQVGTFSSGTNASSTGVFNFGYGPGWSIYKHPFVGWIREAAIFNTALTAQDIDNYYNGTA